MTESKVQTHCGYHEHSTRKVIIRLPVTGAATKEPIRMVLEGGLWLMPGECFSSPMVLNFYLSWRDLV